MATFAVLPAIVIDESGTARIEGTRMPVTQIACEKNGGWSPEEIQAQHPHLTLAQIYVALAYYSGHQAELDAEIEQSYREYRKAWEARQADPAHQAWVESIRQRKKANTAKAGGRYGDSPL